MRLDNSELAHHSSMSSFGVLRTLGIRELCLTSTNCHRAGQYDRPGVADQV